MLGAFYRISVVLFFLLFTYVELIDKANYLNHYYFVSLVTFLMIFLPANSRLSLDVAFGWTRHRKQCLVGYINTLKLQLAIVYCYAGVAKINSDWLLRAQPMKMWLSAQVHKPVLGFLFRYKATAFFFSWAGMAYDVTIPFWLSIKKTRPFAYLAVVGFHLMTGWLFPIGMFPYIMIAATLIFFSPSQHERILLWLETKFRRNPDHGSKELPVSLDPIGVASRGTSGIADSGNVFPSAPQAGLSKNYSKALAGLFVAFFAIQLLFPFRYVMYPGNLFWTEQGYRFSWRVMLMEKAGFAVFTVQDAVSGRKAQANNYEYLTPQQEKMMATQPDMMVQYAHFLAREYEQRGFSEPSVTVDAFVTLNGRANKRYIDPSYNLVMAQDSWQHKTWILND